MQKFIRIYSFLICVFISNLAFSQKEKFSQIIFNYTQNPLSKTEKNRRFFESEVTIAGASAGKLKYSVGKLIPNGKSSKMMGNELDWVDVQNEYIEKYLAVAGFGKGSGGLKVTLSFGKFIIYSSEENPNPIGTTPNGRKLFSTRYIYGIDERLIVKDVGENIILDTLLGSGKDQKTFTVNDQDNWPPSGARYYFVLQQESISIFEMVKSILDDKFGYVDKKVLFKMKEFNDKEYESLSIANDRLHEAANNKTEMQNNKGEILKSINDYENFLKQSGRTLSEGKINDIKYNLAFAYFLNNDYANAKLNLPQSSDGNTVKKKKTGGGLLGGIGKAISERVQVNINGGNILSDFSLKGNKIKEYDLKIDSTKELSNFIEELENRNK